MSLSTINFKDYPGRAKQLRELINLFGMPEDLVPSLYLFGQTATGKTYLIQEIFKNNSKLPFSYIDCIECFTTNTLFETVLNQLYNHYPSPKNSFSNVIQCRSIHSFIQELQKIDPVQTVYLVFDNVRELLELSEQTVSCLLNIGELTGQNYTTILLSDMIWENFRPKNGCIEPIIILLPNYTKEQIIQILLNEIEEEKTKTLYKTFVKLFYEFIQNTSRNLNEIRYLSNLIFPKYVSLSQQETSQLKLYRRIEPLIKIILDHSHMHKITNSELETYWENCESTRSPFEQSNEITEEERALNLPRFSKILLVSVFLASHVPQSKDLQVFTTLIKKRASKKNVDIQSDNKKLLQSPKTFPLDRLLSIFSFFTQAKVDCSSEIYNQLASFVTMGYISIKTSLASLDNINFRCNLSFDIIKEISKSIDIEIGKFLIY
ncbi:origin recognition complex subunit 5 [Anaeramoeba flamelloides]|uniref:Origin recognition complex subunit n=1 Tax=Anaeramoeba flamelloides TaxID=1746091 RepID=A0AAV8A7A6_9EUKA|nr:origin recognition complex subunit [Anaeramoeba flamelloides]KAJ6236435.1 origin recognition complex subunit 5 [Anaeramoeba flamelloides]